MEHFLRTTMEIEFFGTVPIYFGMLIQIFFSLFLGGLVGFDRELKMKAAGFKTNIMICLGATIYTSISMLNLEGASPVIDPNRVSAQIVSGIGFLGAGAILQSRGSIIGLTTAATIWVVAAIGYTIGAGYPLLASMFAFTVLITLRLINPVSILSEKKKDYKFYHIEILSTGSIVKILLETISSENVKIDKTQIRDFNPEKHEIITNVYMDAHPRAIERLKPQLKEIIRIQKVNYTIIDKPENKDKELKVI